MSAFLALDFARYPALEIQQPFNRQPTGFPVNQSSRRVLRQVPGRFSYTSASPDARPGNRADFGSLIDLNQRNQE